MIHICGIIGSKDPKTFEKLCRLNESRGNYSFGGLYLEKQPCYEQRFFIHRGAGVLQGVHPGFDYYLGHNRAPTSNTFEFDPTNSHPFQVGNWIVAHNGIIRNFDELREKYRTTFQVDSNIIPFLLDMYEKGMSDLVERYEDLCTMHTAIYRAFSELSGTFGCWIYNIQYKVVFIIRGTNSIYYSPTDLSFSSVEFEGSNMLVDGMVYQLSAKGLKALYPVKLQEEPFYIPA